jgi:hypothetical protein
MKTNTASLLPSRAPRPNRVSHAHTAPQGDRQHCTEGNTAASTEAKWCLQGRPRRPITEYQSVRFEAVVHGGDLVRTALVPGLLTSCCVQTSQTMQTSATGTSTVENSRVLEWLDGARCTCLLGTFQRPRSKAPHRLEDPCKEGNTKGDARAEHC